MTAIATAPATPARSRGRGLGTLTITEARLFLRDPAAVFFALAFPSVLLLGIGLAIPGAREPVTGDPRLAGLDVIHLWGPVIVATAVATIALMTLPSYVAGYREHGVFRRLSTTPMRPGGVLLAHVVVSGVALLLAVVLAVGAGMVVFDMPVPENLAVTLAALVLTTLALFAFGLLIGGLAPKASTASGLGTLLYFPMLFFAGMWMPISDMPDALATVASIVPLGAASQALTDGWFGGGTPWLELAVLAGWSLLGYPIVAKLFRWS